MNKYSYEVIEMNFKDKDFLEDLSYFYKVFADATRLRILDLLLDGDACVNDIAQKLDLSQSLVSHQLRIMKTAKFVKATRDGQNVIYSIADDHIRIIYKYGVEHLEEL